MDRVLLISNNLALVKIYQAVVKSTLDIEFTVSHNLDEALLLIGNEKVKWDLIICPSFENNIEIGAVMYQYKIEQEMDFSLVLYGNTDYRIEEAHFFNSCNKIDELVALMSELLNLKKKEQDQIKDLSPINISLFKGQKESLFDIYYQSGGMSVILFKKNQQIEIPLIDFHTIEIKNLYMNKEVVGNFMDSLSLEFINSLKAQSNSTLSEDKKININLERAEKGMRILAQKVFKDEAISNDVVEISNFCLKSIDEVLETVPSIFDLCELLTKNITGYLYSHSVMSNSIARYIIGRLSWSSEEYKKIIDHVFFFGDLYLALIFDKYPDFKNEEEALFSDILSGEEKLVVLEHAKISATMIEKFPGIGKVVSKVIREHHGMCDGEGFAQKFLDDISPLSKIVLVSEAFVELLLEMRHIDLSKEEKNQITQELLDRFDKESYHVYIEIIADYITKL